MHAAINTLFMAFTLLSMIALAAACASSTPYAPMDGRYGYSDQKIEENRYRVAFHGNSSTSRETVENYLLFRASELTIEQGGDYFIVLERETEARTDYRTTTPAVYGYYRYGYFHFPYYAYGYPWGYEGTVREIRRYQAVAYILVYQGGKPEGDPRAFAARSVINNLTPYIERPIS